MADLSEEEEDRRISMSHRNFKNLIYVSARLYTFTRNLQYRNIIHMRDMLETLDRIFTNIDELITETINENGIQVGIVDVNES